MSDLISRDDALKVIRRNRHRLEGNGQTYQFMIDQMEHIPTVDAEPVVRCKDCKHCEVATITAQYADGSEKVENLCHRNKWSVRGNDYCSYGERSRTCLSAHHLNAQ